MPLAFTTRARIHGDGPQRGANHLETFINALYMKPSGLHCFLKRVFFFSRTQFSL